MIYKPWPYQDFITEHIKKNLGSGPLVDMGLGKTVATLTAINDLMYDEFTVKKVLVIAPKKVAENVWTTEGQKWDHLKHLKFSLVLGTERQRKEALKAKADIYVINRENTAWLIGYLQGSFPFDMLVVDESSSFKNPSSQRFKSIRIVLPKIKRRVTLTGTPTPNGLLDMWSQMYILDRGKRLGAEFTDYRDKYFVADKQDGNRIHSRKLKTFDPPKKRQASYNAEDYRKKMQNEIYGKDYFQEEIHEKVADICISMKTEDYLDLPERTDRIISIKLSTEAQERYDLFEKERVLALLEAEEITALNAAGLTNKLLQFANGAVYDDAGQYHEVHNEKVEALEEIIEVANGQPVLVFYSYRHDLARLQKYLAKYKPRMLKTPDDVNDWNAGNIQVILAHPASAGHGLNLQAGGNIIVWFGQTWALELYLQGNKRLHRQGQTKPVIVHHLIIKNSMDEDVMEALTNKAQSQDALMKAVKARVDKYRK
jgi:SNF2 family DNA or RNA helicase